MMKKLTIFVQLNGLVILLGGITYVVHFYSHMFVFFLWTVYVHLILFDRVETRNKDKKSIYANKYQYHITDIRFILVWCLFDVVFHPFKVMLPTPTLDVAEIGYELVTFIPKTFAVEIVYDFLFYCQHYLLHKIKFLYLHSHKTHHGHTKNLAVISLYIQDPTELVISNLTLILLSYIVPLYELQYFMWFIFRTLVEQAGHSAFINTDSCFSQFIWLPRLLNIDLNNSDHYNHHAVSDCNYAKRFSLWDKVFKTYKPYHGSGAVKNTTLEFRHFVGIGIVVIVGKMC